jgi:hypothetical protein
MNLHNFCVNLHGFCVKNCGAADAKLRILLDGIAVVQFLRAFLKKRRGHASAREELVHDAGHAGD